MSRISDFEFRISCHNCANGGAAFRSADLTTLALVIVFVVTSMAVAGTREAAEKVREGIASYRSGDYARAAAAFQEADVARPDDLRIAFDRGMALAAQPGAPGLRHGAAAGR